MIGGLGSLCGFAREPGLSHSPRGMAWLLCLGSNHCPICLFPSQVPPLLPGWHYAFADWFTQYAFFQIIYMFLLWASPLGLRPSCGCQHITQYGWLKSDEGQWHREWSSDVYFSSCVCLLLMYYKACQKTTLMPGFCMRAFKHCGNKPQFTLDRVFLAAAGWH